MKKGLFILFVSLIICTVRLKAQSNTDTLTILQTIVNSKANYIGKPFSVLLNHLPIQIRYFSPSRGLAYNRNAEPSTRFAFYFPYTPDQLQLTRPRLIVFWQPILNRTASVALFSQSKGEWSSTIATHYGSAIISDIILEKRE